MSLRKRIVNKQPRIISKQPRIINKQPRIVKQKHLNKIKQLIIDKKIVFNKLNKNKIVQNNIEKKIANKKNLGKKIIRKKTIRKKVVLKKSLSEKLLITKKEVAKTTGLPQKFITQRGNNLRLFLQKKFVLGEYKNLKLSTTRELFVNETILAGNIKSYEKRLKAKPVLDKFFNEVVKEFEHNKISKK